MTENELHISVPKGYFDNLKNRLSQIPVQRRVSLWEKVRPYVALAACFAISVTAGTFLLNRTAPQAESYYDYLAASDMIPVTDPFAILDSNGSSDEDLSPSEIVDYLIETGFTEDQLADVYSE